MPTFDVVSEVDMQEVRNAVDQAARELAQRFDFKGTDSSVELGDDEIRMASASEVESGDGADLSLIHISEPTRPY